MTRRIGGSLVVPIALGALLAGCGFHLRGSDLSASFDTAYVGSAGDVSIGDELERTLGFAGVDVVADRAEADVRIDLIGQEERRRSVSVTQRARAAEYELSLVVRYRIVALDDASGEEPVETPLVPDRAVRAVRVYRIDRANIVGSSEEEALLRGEMEQDLVQQIVRSLDAATRNLQASSSQPS